MPFNLLAEQLNRISGKSELAKAIRYALGRVKKMRGYLENGSLELDILQSTLGGSAISTLNFYCVDAGNFVG
jgi:hypothetical protein